MARQRDRTNVYILLLAVIVAAIAGYYLPTKRPETGASMTPKEYIELVEKKKAQRIKYAAEERAAQSSLQTAPAAADDSAAHATPSR
ncbi:MAG: aldehyde dehydrogenase [Gammaproteobacteria bacterium]|nr:aldehyde dehydrogenase [Gammaproteobacteria bacterium]